MNKDAGLLGFGSRTSAKDLGHAIIEVLGKDHLDNPLLGVSLLSLPCLRIDIKREPTAGMPHQFLHNLTFSPFATKSDEYECRKVCQPILFLIPALRAAG